jgi:hypothetical protein
VVPARNSLANASSPRLALRGLDHQMKVILHQAIKMNLPAGLPAGLGRGFQKPLTITVIFENNLPPVATVQDMIDLPRILKV